MGDVVHSENRFLARRAQWEEEKVAASMNFVTLPITMFVLGFAVFSLFFGQQQE